MNILRSRVTSFHRLANLFERNFLDGQTWQGKSFSQSVNLLCIWPLSPYHLVLNKISQFENKLKEIPYGRNIPKYKAFVPEKLSYFISFF